MYALVVFAYVEMPKSNHMLPVCNSARYAKLTREEIKKGKKACGFLYGKAGRYIRGSFVGLHLAPPFPRFPPFDPKYLEDPLLVAPLDQLPLRNLGPPRAPHDILV